MSTKKQEITRVRKKLLNATKGDKQLQSIVKDFNFGKIKKSKLERV